jgi:molybdopterin synthase catalytic subunit
MDQITLRDESFDPYEVLADFSRALGSRRAAFGASAHFVGTLRNHNEGRVVERLWLEHYPGMTEQAIARLVTEERDRRHFGPALIWHRVGDVLPGDTLVVIAVWSPHRRAALEGCQVLIERLKHEAPLWKQEFGSWGSAWVEKNTLG